MEEDLKKLVLIVVQQKDFSFQEEMIPFACEELIASGILIKQPKKIEIASSNEFTISFYNYFANKLDFILDDNFASSIDFYLQVENEFKEESKSILGLFEQMENLLIYLIKRTNKEFGVSFQEFALSLKKDDHDRLIYFFSSAFFKSLDDLSIEARSLYPIIMHIYEQIKSDAYIDLNVSELMNGIQRLCTKIPDIGKELLKLHIEDEPKPVVVNIHTSIITGLYKSDRANEIEKIKELAKSSSYHISIACMISASSPKDNYETTCLLDIIDSINSESIEYLSNLPRIYVNFINSDSINNPEIIKRCFNRLQILLDNKSLQIKQLTLWQLQFIKEYEDEVFKIIDSLNSDQINEDLYANLIKILHRFDNQDYFFKFLRNYSQENKWMFDSIKFNSPIRKFRDQHPSEFDKNLIVFLIDNEGGIRFIGKRILTQITHGLHGINKFEHDILNLSAIEQYKLWVSILQDSQEPKYTIPLLLPLRNSKNSIVKEAFFCKIEELISCYSSSVISTLEEYLNSENEVDKTLLNRITNKHAEYLNNIKRKISIKELDPGYTQALLLQEFNERYYNRLSSKTEETSSNETSFLSMIPKITLAKGGGWKHGPNGQVSQLTQFSAGFQLPREYYINPERFDFENRVARIENWKNYFKEWEEIISSSESI